MQERMGGRLKEGEEFRVRMCERGQREKKEGEKMRVPACDEKSYKKRIEDKWEERIVSGSAPEWEDVSEGERERDRVRGVREGE